MTDLQIAASIIGGMEADRRLARRELDRMFSVFCKYVGCELGEMLMHQFKGALMLALFGGIINDNEYCFLDNARK